ncbi:hypothetical protein [Polaribacter sp.]|uniref:hypothetical protein n=1 Tax=Polaribacter sp. TaxID=1920175 RepID=UPI003F6C7B11
MIHYVKRKDLDTEKYNYCIENSLQSRVYAFSWYLDVVADHWDVLVLEEYKAVMPIPWKKKYGIKYVTQPYFCQQLGVFSIDTISKNQQEIFLKHIPKKYLKVTLSLNSKNILISNNLNRLNYFLKIPEDYKQLYKNFSKGRKHAIKVGEKEALEVKNTTANNLLRIHKKHYNFTIPEDKLIKLVKIANTKKAVMVKGVFKAGVLLGGAIFIVSNTRIIYLFSVFTEEGRKFQASSFLISIMLKGKENIGKILDFEGGNLENIGRFYRSFGAKEEHYSVFKRTFL